MLNSDTAERIRAIFLHEGSSVTLFDFAILLGWDASTVNAAIKWHVVTLDDSAGDVPRVSHAQLILHAREQWAEAEIVEALGDDARLFDPRAPFTPPPQIPTLSYVRDLAPFTVRPSSAAPAAAAAVSGDAFAPRRAAVDVDPDRGVYKVNFDEIFGPRPAHVPCTLPTPAQRRRELRDMRRAAALAEAPLPPARRRRADGIREATFTATVTEYQKVVPYLRLRGQWLAQLGFKPKTRIYIAVEPGRLVITAADPAAAVRSAASAPAAVAPIARRARGTRRAAAAAAAR